MTRGRSPGASSVEYPATFPPSNRLIHFATHLVPSLHGRSRSTSPRFSLYPGGASSKGRFMLILFRGMFVRWRSSRASSSNSFSLVWWASLHWTPSAMASMIPRSTAGWILGLPCITFLADLGDMDPPRIWASKLSCELSGPTNCWISWLVRAGYFSHIICARSSLVGSGGANNIPNSLLWLMEKPPSDMFGRGKGSGCLLLCISYSFYH